MKRRVRNTVRVRVPDAQAPILHVPGKHGGWFISALYAFGTDLEVSLDDLRKLIAGSRGAVIVARRMVGSELQMFESYRRDSDAEVHGTIVNNEDLRFRRAPRR